MSPDVTRDLAADRFLRASEWFARMRGPEAEDARAEFETWRSDPANLRAYAEIETIWAASAASRPRTAGARRQWLRPGLVAAGIAAAVTLGLLVHGYGGRVGREPARLFATERGTIREVALGDGSHVTLDTASRVRTAFDRGERQVALLAGRARFTVAHDLARPFVVTAGDYAVVARGTVFDVRIEGGMTQVTLVEGAVDLERRAGGRSPQLLGRLQPGETARFMASEGQPRIMAAARESWTSGVLAADGMRLADLVREAGRYSATPIVLADPSLGDLKVSGGFRLTDAGELSAGLAAALDLTVTRSADGALVLSRVLGTPVVLPPRCPEARKAC